MADQLDRLTTALADRYAIKREIGSGGMATVYLAEDLRHHRKVAVKVLRPDLAAALGPERFLREIEVAAKLQHPHILPLHDSGEADGFLYYVMPYVEGQSLRDKLVKEGELPIGDAVRILRDVVDALTEAHASGVVHRDIKPENILLRGRHALVTDFGVAKAVSEATGRAKLTTDGVALGTPTYMAPEQAAADPHLDHRVDLYGVGAMAYELLTGRPVFMGTTPQQVLSAHLTEAPQPVTTLRETVPAPLEQAVMRCLEKKPADRFQSAEELLSHLEALTTPSGGVTPTDTPPVVLGGRSRWLVTGGLAGAAVLIVAAFVGARLLTSRPIAVTTSNIRAVTREPGMEWHPALSPDGDEVAFVARRGDRQSVIIRSTLHIAGGGELTPTQGYDDWETSPSWSPDGEFVRFWSCPGSGACFFREIAKYGGPIRSIELPRNAESCSWSPDGARAVCVAPPDSIVTYSAGNGAASLVAVHPRFLWDLHSPVWSPDGRWIAYVQGNRAWYSSFNVDASSIWMVDANGGEPLQVTSEDHMDTSPAWLDNDHLLFISNRDGPREVYVVQVTGAGPSGEPRKVPGVTDPHSISYSIAGRKLAFSKATVRQNIWSYPIAFRPVSVGNGHAVTDDNAAVESHDISPNGEWIAFDSDLRGNQDIYRRPLDGGIATPMVESPLDDWIPRWSPDGTEIVFIRDAGGGEWMVMVILASGGTPVQIATGSPLWGAEWSPSGLDIAFMKRGSSGLAEPWLVSRDAIGGRWHEPAQLTDAACLPTDWSPDGSGVLCRGAGGEETVLLSRDGEVLRRYGRMLEGRPKFARDGSTIYYYGTDEDGSEGIWARSPQGDEPRLVVAYDRVDIVGTWRFSVGPHHLYITVQEAQSDIWVADVEVER